MKFFKQLLSWLAPPSNPSRRAFFAASAAASTAMVLPEPVKETVTFTIVAAKTMHIEVERDIIGRINDQAREDIQAMEDEACFAALGI